MARAQHQEAVAVGQGLAVGAAGAQHAEPFRAGFTREHVAELVGGLGGIFGEEHAVAAGRFGELAGRDLGQVGTLLEALMVFTDLAIGPGRGEQGQAGHGDGHGMATRSTGLNQSASDRPLANHTTISDSR